MYGNETRLTKSCQRQLAPHRRYASGDAGTTIADVAMSDGLTVQSGRMRTIIIWIASVLLLLGFGGAGLAKVMGAEPMVQSLASYGLPTWFVTLLGVGEIVGAIGLLVRPMSSLAALGLTAIAFGAIVNHAVNPPITMAIPAIILLILSLAVAWMRGGDFATAATRLLPPPTR